MSHTCTPTGLQRESSADAAEPEKKSTNERLQQPADSSSNAVLRWPWMMHSIYIAFA
jgi:hypothetical protein